MTLEELLNKLIALGWKPRGYDSPSDLFVEKRGIGWIHDVDGTPTEDFASYNDLCSIDSGLWQFVCGQALFNEDMKHREIKYYNEANGATFVVADYWDYKYRLMLSSIQPDKEKFLLDNIRID